MNLTSIHTVKQILWKYGVKPSRSLGQNFLINSHVIKKFVAVSDTKPQETILEIGPGLGTLTQELCQRAKRVIAVEKDRSMVEILTETLAGFKRVRVVHADILTINFQFSKRSKSMPLQDSILLPRKYKVVANLPYSITAPVIRKFLEFTKVQPCSMIVMAQKEVAQRICAKPPKMNLLAVSVQIYAQAKIISYVKKTSFWPQPKVDSAILHINPIFQAYPLDFPKFFTVVKAGFSHPRKQLLNNISTRLTLSRQQTAQWLLQNNIQSSQRAQTLSLQDWINLTASFPS